MFSSKTAENKQTNKTPAACLRVEEPEDYFFQAINRRGDSIRCEVLFTFESDGQNYLVYTDNTHTIMGRLNVYATLYHPATLASGRPLYLRDPETETEWRLIERMTARIMRLS